MGKWIATAIVIAAAVLAGCGDQEEAKTTLTFWHIMNYEGPREVIEAAVKRFEAANPNVKVNIETFANDPYKDKLNIELASGTPPDVFHTWGGGGLRTLVDAGRVLDLTEAIERDGWRERFLPASLSFCKCGDKTYAVPLDLSCVPVWYNADIFAEHQLTPPRTFPELLDICKKLRAKGVTPMALGNMKQWPGAFYFIYLATRSGGSQLFADAAARRPGKAFNDPAFVRAGELLQRLVEHNAFPTGFNGIEHGHARKKFITGQAAMYVMGTWLVARVKDERTEFLSKMKCFAFPSVASGKGDPTTIVGGVNCAFAVSAECKHPKEAVELLRFLTAEQVGSDWSKTGRIPALRVSDETLVNLARPTRAALNLLKSAKAIQQYYDQYLGPRLAEEHKKTTRGLFAGTLTPAQAAGRMEKLARELARTSGK